MNTESTPSPPPTQRDAETVTCSQCGETVDYDDSGSDDLCRDCYRETLTDCQICKEGVEETQVSPYILVKTEFAETGNRLPGIYRIKSRPFMTSGLIGSSWLHGDDILFIDRLPRRDAAFEISGNICCGCAEAHGYRRADRCAYGKAKDRDILTQRERQRVLDVVAEHPEILLDLETDVADEDLHRWCPLPVFAPTYRPLLFLEYKGVKIYRTGGESWRGEPYVGWLTLRPEPSCRSAYHLRGVVFAPSGLKTWEDIKLDPNRTKDQWGAYYDSGYRYGHEADYRRAAREACIRAIDQGLITATHAPEDAR